MINLLEQITNDIDTLKNNANDLSDAKICLMVGSITQEELDQKRKTNEFVKE